MPPTAGPASHPGRNPFVYAGPCALHVFSSSVGQIWLFCSIRPITRFADHVWPLRPNSSLTPSMRQQPQEYSELGKPGVVAHANPGFAVLAT
jgi:hypothetical protein